MIKVCVVGLGYVGLPLAAHLAGAGFHVTGYDHDTQHITRLMMGIDTRGILAGRDFNIPRLRFSTTIPPACDIYFICVPTPAVDGHPDQSFVIDACEAVGSVLPKEGGIVVVESTVVPGSTATIFREAVMKTHGNDRFAIAYSPERINPGPNAFEEYTKDHKIVGYDGDPSDIATLMTAYRCVFDAATHIGSTKAAELAKCFENTQRDVNIALMNELSMQCHQHGIDFNHVVKGLRTKKSSPVFHSGMVGGHCIAVDPHYLNYFYGGSSIAEMGRFTNEDFIMYVFSVALEEAMLIDKPRVLVVGKSYKPDVIDVRNSGAIEVYNRLQQALPNAVVDIHDAMIDAPYSEDSTTYDVIVGAVNHSNVATRKINYLYRTHPNTVFINVGGFESHQLLGINRIITL
jgi:UDP-N-acetyl-D-galactosamine dehydrogenase